MAGGEAARCSRIVEQHQRRAAMSAFGARIFGAAGAAVLLSMASVLAPTVGAAATPPPSGALQQYLGYGGWYGGYGEWGGWGGWYGLDTAYGGYGYYGLVAAPVAGEPPSSSAPQYGRYSYYDPSVGYF